MSLKHLNDEELQEFLDGNLSRENALLVERHLETCLLCRESLKQYQSLYAGLIDDKGFDLSEGFVKSVISRLPAQAKAKSYFKYVNILLTTLGIVLAMGITFYYVDLKPFAKMISNILLPQYEFGSALVSSIKGFLVGFNGDISLLFWAGMTLLIIVVLDHLVLQSRYKRISF